MTWVDAMLAAFLATVGRGRWWIASLAAFLVRGGLIAFLPALVLLPTPAELAANLEPSLTGASPGDLTAALLELVAQVVAVAAVCLVVTTAIGVWIESALVAAAAADEELEAIGRPMHLPMLRAVVARLAAHVPTLIAVVVAGLALAGAAYAELVSPSGSGSLPLRAVARAPLPVIALVGCWLLGEAWGGLALRRLAAGSSLDGALVSGLAGLLRPSGLATFALTSTVVAVPAIALWLASSRAFERLLPLIVDRAEPWAVGVGLGLLVATWAAGLWLLAIGLAYRSAAWTAEALRPG